LHPFGLEQIDGEQIRPDDLIKSEDQYDSLDALVTLTAPSSAIRRQFDRFYDAGQTSSSSSSGSSDICVASGNQQQQSRDNEYSILMRKRAIRAIFQPLKVGILSIVNDYLSSCHVKSLGPSASSIGEIRDQFIQQQQQKNSFFDMNDVF
jgi:hypothetical protein